MRRTSLWLSVRRACREKRERVWYDNDVVDMSQYYMRLHGLADGKRPMEWCKGIRVMGSNNVTLWSLVVQ